MNETIKELQQKQSIVDTNVNKEIAKIKQQIEEMREMHNAQDDEKKEETEEEKVKKWLENTVKLPQYYQVFMEQGFEDLESIGHVTENNLKEMGIDKIGHRNKIIRYSRQLNQPQQEIIPPPQAAYSQNIVKNAIEGPNVYDTAGQ